MSTSVCPSQNGRDASSVFYDSDLVIFVVFLGEVLAAFALAYYISLYTTAVQICSVQLFAINSLLLQTAGDGFRLFCLLCRVFYDFIYYLVLPLLALLSTCFGNKDSELVLNHFSENFYCSLIYVHDFSLFFTFQPSGVGQWSTGSMPRQESARIEKGVVTYCRYVALLPVTRSYSVYQQTWSIVALEPQERAAVYLHTHCLPVRHVYLVLLAHFMIFLAVSAPTHRAA